MTSRGKRCKLNENSFSEVGCFQVPVLVLAEFLIKPPFFVILSLRAMTTRGHQTTNRVNDSISDFNENFFIYFIYSIFISTTALRLYI